jgi:hypothetical protein
MFIRLTTIAFATLLASNASVWATSSSAPVYPGQALTLLTNGDILATGGFDNNGKGLSDAYIIAPTGSYTKLQANLLYPRGGHSATALPDGTVLIFGGKDNPEKYVRTMEIYDPQSSQFAEVSGRQLLPRCNHTGTLLTDGRVVIIGGTGEGGAFPTDIQFWDYRNRNIAALDVAPVFKMRGQSANLLSDGRVLLTGGMDSKGAPVSEDETFDPSTHTFLALGKGAQEPGAGVSELALSASIPSEGDPSFPISSIISLRFSTLIDVRSATADTIVLDANDGTEVGGTISSAEAGRLAFFTPNSPLAPGTSYTLRIRGVTDSVGANILDQDVHFQTSGDIDDGSNDGWIPTISAFAGNWGTGTGNSSWQELPALKAKPGATALAGQVLGLSGKPLAHVTLQIESTKTTSDATGRFLLSNLSPGHHVLMIDGTTANKAQATYGFYEAGVDIIADVTNVLNYTIWMTRLDTVDAVQISSPTAQDSVVTTPKLPGLSLHLPTGTSIVDHDNQPVTQLSITPIPLDKPPFPLPTGVRIPIYFTIQPGGSQITVASQGQARKGAQIFYPNTYNDPPGTLYHFWNYDATSKGWYIYGDGRVSPDRTTIVPNSDVFVYELTGAMVGVAVGPAIGACQDPECTDGDPVDLSTGQFVYQKTDLVIADTFPIHLTRT